MASEIILLLVSIVFFILAGSVLIALMDRSGSLGLNWVVKAAVSFMLGLGAISLEMFIYSVVSIPFNIPYIIIPWVAIFLYVIAVPVKRRLLRGTEKGVSLFLSSIGAPDWIFIAIILSQLFYVFLFAPLLPVTGWDSFQTWYFKAAVFFSDKGIRPSFFFTSPFVHPDYPLLVPLSAAWVYTCLGHVNDQLGRFIYAPQYAALLTLFYYFVRKTSTTRFALIFTAVLSITPIIIIHSAGLPVSIGELYQGDFVGYADLPLSIYFLGAAGFFYLYTLDEKRSHIMLSSLFLGFGAWTKDEGLPFALSSAFLMALHILIRRKQTLKSLASLFAILAVTTGPWLIYKAILRFPGEYEGHISLGTTLKNLNRLPHILNFMKMIFFKKTSLYSYTWYLYVITSLINWRGFLKRPLVYLNIMLLSQFAIYTLIYLITFLDIDFHLRTSFDRLVLQMLPLAMLITAINLSRLLSITSRAPAPGE